MLYKTIVLELLQARPSLHRELCSQRKLLATVEQQALELRESHLAWKEQIQSAHPQSAEFQVASEALELALEELIARLPPESDEESDQ